MAYLLKVKLLATEETIVAYDYYEDEQPGVGEKFLTELENCYQKILLNPYAFSFFENPYRQAKLVRFPYVVVYEIEENTIVVFSVFDTNQDPGIKSLATKF